MVEKILIVDDDVQTLRLVGLMLERQGYKIIAANNGIQALHSARTEHPDAILLDIMMPDLDGFEVTRRLRKLPETGTIPIIMFTAKGQIEDKVTGYQAGADDYLSKPIHPAELSAHLRALLSRRKAPSGPLPERGYVIGVVAPKGGMGVSTLVLNLALMYHKHNKGEVTVAELRPGQGTWGIELGQKQTDGLCNLLRLPASDINLSAVENELVRSPYGIRMLLASARTTDCEVSKASDQLEAILDTLSLSGKLVFLDIGTNSTHNFDMLLNQCNELIVVTEPFPSTVYRTRHLIEDLQGRGFGKSKYLSLVSINRIRADVQLTITQMQEILGQPIVLAIPPAPELAYQAAMRNIPLTQVHVGNLVSLQYSKLAEQIALRVPA